MGDSGSALTISGSYAQDLARFRQVFERCADVVYRSFALDSGRNGTFIFIVGLVDEQRLEAECIRPLMREEARGFAPSRGPLPDPADFLHADRSESETDIAKAAEAVCQGKAALLLEGERSVTLVNLLKWDKRAVEEPASEPVIRGPRDGFTESLASNLALVRRRLATTDLKVELMRIGDRSKTSVAVVYLDSLVLPGVLKEARERLSRIRIDAVLESGYLEELIADNPYSVFPQLLNTERPDRVVGGMLEGRVAILTDNTPFALVAPGTYVDSLQASEDYYQNYIVSSATRLLRFWLSFSALVFPSIYIAVTTFHQEMIPTSLLFSIASSREAVPFPGIVEAFVMEAAFEGLREAGIRLPRPVGQAVSIVGALVIGQAAVQAGIVSAMLVIVVSFTGIASFIFPIYAQGLALRFLRFPMMLLAGTLGMYGLFLGLLALLIHLCKLRSFGVPYLSPLVPLQADGMKDSMIRAPWWRMVLRPQETGKRNRRRIRAGSRPGPPSGGESGG
ncbi:spore germination protein [Cohnella caldifontis]|uniref:spore germination protein n=1 Tax=Cohnella caldifontis TaxID=3027471 RepID=UPI0023EA9EAE|nr:spore germination protein [Cohnella sp. YIM B05605]